MSFKDHPIVLFIAGCAATAAATWTVSEQVRVNPIKERLALEVEESKGAPVISDITLTRIAESTGLVIEQNVSYSDSEGDATFINWIVLETNRPGISVTSGAILDSVEIQKNGANAKGTWACGPDTYYVKFRVIVTDRGGHASKPHDYTLNCNA